jgi:hypothetical protein
MAMPKFTLTMGDGAEVRTLEELREHADIYTLEQCYFNGTLLRWLKAWEHPWEQIMGDIERYDGDYTLHETLCDAFQIPWSEELEIAYEEMKATMEQTTWEEDQEGEPQEEQGCERAAKITGEDADNKDDKGYEMALDKIARYVNGRCSSTVSGIATKNYVYTYDFLFFSLFRRMARAKGDVACFSLKTGGILARQENPNIENLPIMVHGDTIYYLESEQGKNILFSCDLPDMSTGKILEWQTTLGQNPVFTLQAGEDTIVLSDENGLRLLNLKNRQETKITAHGKRIDARGNGGCCALLANDIVYFYAYYCEGRLDDGCVAEGALCKYDCISGCTSVVLSQKELAAIDNDPILAVTPLWTDGQNLLLGRTTAGLRGYKDNDLWLAKVKMGIEGEHAEVVETTPLQNCWGMKIFDDGLFYITQKEGKAFITFIDYQNGCNAYEYLLWEPQLATWTDFKDSISDHANIRLGDWFYFAIKGKNDYYERWKISLRTGERIELPIIDFSDWRKEWENK